MFHFVYDYFKSQPVGEATSADSDALEHAVASKLMHNESSVDPSRLLDFIGNDATYEMRMSAVQVVHQFHQGLLKAG